jgi:hypothetical protein
MTTSLLGWRPVFGDRRAYYAFSPFGIFRGGTSAQRTVLTLNDVRVGSHRDPAGPVHTPTSLLRRLPSTCAVNPVNLRVYRRRRNEPSLR